jgi:2-keto-4-pentenoate hydratase
MKMNFSTLQPSEAASELEAAHQARQPFQSLLLAGRPLSLEEAYQVQEACVHRLVDRGLGQVVGYKVGLTSVAMQQMCSISSPVYGAVLEKRLQQTPSTVNPAEFGRLGIECEIAVRLGTNIEAGSEPLTAREVADAVDAIAPAFELVDDRNADYKFLDAGSLIADNAWNAGVVLGKMSPLTQGLGDRLGTLHCNGALVGEAFVRDALGDPLESVRWLAQELGRRGRSLQPGQIVMTGSILPTKFPGAGEQWVYQVVGLGSVTVET